MSTTVYLLFYMQYAIFNVHNIDHLRIKNNMIFSAYYSLKS
jgi:hypothetical protein